MENCKKLIIINTYGKCASTSLYKTLLTIDKNSKIHHVHGLVDNSSISCENLETDHIIACEGKKLLINTRNALNDLNSKFDKKIIIIGLRDSYSYILSAFMQTTILIEAKQCDTNIYNLSSDIILNIFYEYVYEYCNNSSFQSDEQKLFNDLADNPNRWIVEQLENFNITLPSKELRNNGYAIRKVGDVEFIFYIYEMLEFTENKLIQYITGKKYSLLKENITSKKEISSLYQILKENFTPPQKFLDKLYDNSVSSCIYVKPQLNTFGTKNSTYIPKIKKNPLKILQISPCTFHDNSIIGGGEKIVLYINKALQIAAANNNIQIETAICTLNGIPFSNIKDNIFESLFITGSEWDVASIKFNEVEDIIKKYDIVYVNQALTRIGLCVAACARLLGKYVLGMDSGGGEYHKIIENSKYMQVFSAFHCLSIYSSSIITMGSIPNIIITGPVDCEHYKYLKAIRNNTILAVGRILPHKGFERLIEAVPSCINVEIIGRPYDNEYLHFLKSISNNKKIKFIHNLDDEALKNKMSKAFLYVHPSTMRGYNNQFYLKSELLGLAPLEALSMGTPTFVSNAAALPELSTIKGCYVFDNVTMLRKMIEDFYEGKMSIPDEATIHASVKEQYGLEQFGEKLLLLMLEGVNENTYNL